MESFTTTQSPTGERTKVTEQEYADFEATQSKIATLERELEALRADKARLDWVAVNLGTLRASHVERQAALFVLATSVPFGEPKEIKQKAFRRAVDEDMKNEAAKLAQSST